MFCKQCGTNLPDNAAFCNNCGTPVSSAPAAASEKTSPDSTAAYDPFIQGGYENPYETPAVTPSSEKGNKKTGLIIAIVAIAVVLIIGITVLLTIILGSEDSPLSKGQNEDETTTSQSAEVDKPELLSDPISYFIQQPDGYYKVTTDPNVDFYIYPEYGSSDHYSTRFAGNELIFVYGTYEGWACFEYEDSTKGYAWCKTASIYKTDETPTQPEPETVYVYTTPQQPSASPVYTGSYYRVRGTGSDGLNLRESPNTSAYVYVVLQESELVYVHQTDGTWSYVSTVDHRTGNSYSGWCANQYLSYAY